MADKNYKHSNGMILSYVYNFLVLEIDTSKNCKPKSFNKTVTEHHKSTECNFTTSVWSNITDRWSTPI